MDRSKYPADWPQIRERILVRSGFRCECDGICGLHRGQRCIERHNTLAVYAKGNVCLTIAHLDHDTTNNADDNLRALCQRCHLRYDRPLHAENAAKTRDRKRGQQRIF